MSLSDRPTPHGPNGVASEPPVLAASTRSAWLPDCPMRKLMMNAAMPVSLQLRPEYLDALPVNESRARFRCPRHRWIIRSTPSSRTLRRAGRAQAGSGGLGAGEAVHACVAGPERSPWLNSRRSLLAHQHAPPGLPQKRCSDQGTATRRHAPPTHGQVREGCHRRLPFRVVIDIPVATSSS